MKNMQLTFAFITGFCFQIAFGCGDNSHPPQDSFTFDDFDGFPDKFSYCPLPPPEQMEEGCRFECVPTGNHWKCWEVCECDEDNE